MEIASFVLEVCFWLLLLGAVFFLILSIIYMDFMIFICGILMVISSILLACEFRLKVYDYFMKKD
ncbi:hypothetical protein GCM10023206_16190 [Acinetobacter puyangensis]|uniref:Uncharacterized protein n=1 Tax=Acinetobacter puyangensis TaxID=1096779 RepID=A0A240E8U4_9GAMM|nr:hypothetical protein SAMN05421731_10414 [Acinetobacter puyangensis]